MNQPRFRPRVVRPRGAPAPDFAAFQDTPTAEAAQRAAIEQARLNAGVPESPPPPIQLDIGRMPHVALPRRGPVSQSEFFGGQPVVQLDPVLAGRSQAALTQAMAENRLTPEYQLEQAAARRAAAPPSDATADELRALGYDEQNVARYASDARDAPGARPGPSAADAVRRLSARTPALPDGIPHQRPAPIVRRGAMDVPSMPSTAPSLDEGYAVRDGQLIPRAQPMQIPEGYAVTQDGQVLPRAEPVPMSFVPTEQGGPTQSDLSPQDYAAMRSQGPAMTQGPNMSSDPSLYRSTPQGQGAASEDNATMPVPVYDGGEVTIEAGMYPADENGFPLAPQSQQRAPRVGVPRRRTAPYVAGLPNAPGGTTEMPSALQQPTAWPVRPAVARRTPLDTQMDTLGLNVQYAMSRAEDAQDAGQRLADIEIARQRRMNENQMDRERAEGLARAAVQRAADRAASIRIDPSRAMQGASGIANVIAVVLGGIGSGITGGPNQPLQMVQQNIERDLAAQRTDLDTARNAVADQQSILGNIRQEFQTREAADNAFREFALRQAAAEVEVQAGRANYAEARDRANNLREQLVNAADQARAAAERTEMEQLLAFDRSRAETGYFDARSRGANATAAREEARARAQVNRPRYPFGTLEWWQSQTPQQQAQRLENVQNTLLTGTTLRDAQVMYGVPEGGVAGERAPVENGARMAPPGAGGRVDSIELGRQLTNANTLIAGGMPAQEAEALSGLPPGSIHRMALPAELTARVNVVDANLRQLEDVVAAGGDVPGFGIFDGRLPDFATPEGARLRRAADSLADAHQRMMSGAGGAVQEVQFYRDLLRGDGTEEGLRIGLETMRREMNSVLGNTAGIGSNVEAQDNVAAQLGIAPRVETPAPAPRPRLIAPPRPGQTAGPGSME